MTPFVQWSASHDLRHAHAHAPAPAPARRAGRGSARSDGRSPRVAEAAVRAPRRWVVPAAVLPVIAAAVAIVVSGVPT